MQTNLLIKKYCPSLTNSQAGEWADAFSLMFVERSISTRLEVSALFATVIHESAGLSRLVENLNYSEKRLLQVFPKYFNAEQAKSYAGRPFAIGSRVYADRMGNGNEASGDGYKYRGRGCIQLTGFTNYKLLSAETNVPAQGEPDCLITPKYGAQAVGWFWARNNIGSPASIGAFDHVCDLVNRGRKTDAYGDSIGFAARNQIYQQLLKDIV